ncbi:hypothetical protein ES705_29599 [subsurface metagenome]
MRNKKILTLIFVVAFLTLLVGCFPQPTNQVPVITSIPITAVDLGETYTYDVNATDPDGDNLTYSLTTKPTNMTIKSTTGVISWTPTFAQVGDNPVTVVVSDGTLSVIQNFTITVSEPSVPPVNQKPIIKSYPRTTAIVGETYTYTVKAIDPDGDILTYSIIDVKPIGMTINSANGFIWWIPTSTQIGDNLITVKVSDGALSDTQSFIVKVSEPELEPELTKIIVDPKVMNLFVGDFGTFEVTAHYDNETTKIVTSKCRYESSNSSIAYVFYGFDKVTTLTVGTATIFISYTQYNFLTGDEITRTDTIAVTVKELTEIVVLPETMDLLVGEKKGIKSVTAHYSDGSEDDEIDFADCDFASDDEDVATVSDAGLVTAVGEGEANITVTYKGKEDTITVTVNPVTVTGVTLEPTNLDLTAGDDPVTLVVTISPANATNKSVTWDSSNDLVATVDDGVVTPLTAGTATITVTTVDGGFTATCEVGVSAAPPTYLQLCAVGDSTAEWTNEHAYSGSYSVKLYVMDGVSDWAQVSIPVDIAIESFTALSFYEYIDDYNPNGWTVQVILGIDADDNGIFEADLPAWHQGPDSHTTIPLNGDTFIEFELRRGSNPPKDIWTERIALEDFVVWFPIADGTRVNWFYKPYTEFLAFLDTTADDSAIDKGMRVKEIILQIGGAGSWMDETVYVDDIKVNGETYDLEP